MSAGGVLVDCAGARMGGALRFLTELDGYLRDRPDADVRLVGRERRVAPSWLVRRERLRRPERSTHPRRTVALNNVSFVASGGERWVLLRNLLHFLPAAEAAALPGGLPAGVAGQARIVRACARRADVIVVPTTSMGRRVVAALPSVAARVVVRPHPLSPVGTAAGADLPFPEPGAFLCPVLFAPFKAMGRLLRPIDDAAGILAARTGERISVTVTATEAEARREGLADRPHLRFVGRLAPEQLATYQRSHRMLVYPTRIESFGYPLAEARLTGIPVVAPDTAHAREVAGPVLLPYQRDDPDDIVEAMAAALAATPRPEAGNPFDPVAYFDWLLGVRAPAGSLRDPS